MIKKILIQKTNKTTLSQVRILSTQSSCAIFRKLCSFQIAFEAHMMRKFRKSFTLVVSIFNNFKSTTLKLQAYIYSYISVKSIK